MSITLEILAQKKYVVGGAKSESLAKRFRRAYPHYYRGHHDLVVVLIFCIPIIYLYFSVLLFRMHFSLNHCLVLKIKSCAG